MHSLTIRIPQPCAESWADMTPTGPGRHCAACQKTVIDFTQKTDAEILAYLAQAAGQVCGRLQAAQLGRPLQLQPTTSRWRTWLSTLLAVGSLGTLLAPKAAAQYHYSGSAGPLPTTAPPGRGLVSTPGTSADLASAPAAAEATPASSLPGGALVIRGVVRDATTHEPLPGVTVLVKGTAQGAATDENGRFVLPVATEPAAATTLLISFVGYSPVEQLAVAGVPVAVELHADTFVLGGDIVITSGRLYRPWPWHPRRLYYWSKAHLARALGR